MRIGIVGFGNLTIMQYLFKYTAVLDRQNVDYDVICWNRLDIEETADFRGNLIIYDVPVNTFQPFWRKIADFIRYAVFLRKTIRKNKYEKLIVLTTPTAMVLVDWLLGKYKGRYIYDYRDLTKEKKLKLYKKLVEKLIKSADVTMMSSMGFARELGLSDWGNILMAHNTHRERQETKYRVCLSDRDPIRLVFWGMVRQLEHNKRLCDCFGNDDRFQLTFHGTGFYREIEEYCKQKDYKNITFTGVFTLKDVQGFSRQTDILHNCYENDEEMKPALAVKLYDAVEFRLPFLVSADSYMAEFTNNMAGSYTIDLAQPNGLADRVYAWYRGLNAEEVEAAYQAMEQTVEEDDYRFAQRLAVFCQTE